MGSRHSIWEDLLEDTSFGLIAIHSSLEDYALAYALNAQCGIRLARMHDDLLLGESAAFSVYQWKDQKHFRDWTLMVNPGTVEEAASDGGGLFSSTPSSRRVYLIPERKEVDFFLKIEGEEPEEPVLPKVLAVPKVLTAYRLEAAELKSKHNLIF